MTPLSTPTGNLVVELEGRGTLTIRPNDYVSQGGEGIVYRANQTVIKVYHDPEKMRRDGMPDKLRMLSKIKHPYIVGPEGVVLDFKGSPIGFWMPYAEGEPLSRIFTTSFRTRAGFGDEDAKQLVERMRETVSVAHGHGALLIDGNELNWRALLSQGKTGPEPRVIDVDSWEIGRWPATVIMPSIRDWSKDTFTEMTDWFSWGIVTFQVFTGIHPYKGTLPGFDRGDLVGRMRLNASVFDPAVVLNQAVRSFTCIPGRLLDWYRQTFADGYRSTPPSVLATGGPAMPQAARTARVVTGPTGSLQYDLLLRPSQPAVRTWPCGVVLLRDGTLVDLAKKNMIGHMLSRDGEVVKVDGGWMAADVENGRYAFACIDERTRAAITLRCDLSIRRIFRYENRLFAITETGMIELQFMRVGRPLLTLGRQTAILQPKATQWFDGVGIMDAAATIANHRFLITPFGEKACAITRIPELDFGRPVAAKAGHRFVTVVSIDKAGQYQKTEITFSKDYATHTVWQGTTDSADLNIALLPKGVCATIVRDGELDIFVPTSGTLSKVSDSHIATTMELANWGDTVIYLERGEAWSLKMK